MDKPCLHTELQSAHEESIRFDVMSALMEGGRTIDHASSLMLLVTLAAIAYGGLEKSLGIGLLLTATGLTLLEKYYALKTAIDTKLFTVLALHPYRTVSFDRAIVACSAKIFIQSIRTPADRCAGGKQLLQRQAAALGLQIVLAVSIMAYVLHAAA